MSHRISEGASRAHRLISNARGALFGLVALASVAPAAAHPLGNNTVNRLAIIRLSSDEIRLTYLFDFAEIPALMASQSADADRDGQTTAREWAQYANAWAASIDEDLRLEVNGLPLRVALGAPRWWVAPGVAGLFTLRFQAVYSAKLPDRVTHLHYRDEHEPERVGWKEVIVTGGDGVRLIRSSVPSVDPTQGLTRFPSGLGVGLPNELAADVEFAAAPIAAEQKPGLAVPPPADESARPTSIESSPSIHAPHSLWQNAWPLYRLGIHHIATGWDHLAFLLGLLLMRQSLVQLLKVVTAFTIAHSITLALAANGLIALPGSLIEPAIALTVAYVGLVSLIWQRSRHSTALAFCFGLVHGFGFAGALAESLGTRGSLRGAWLVNLASFNLGIESFQVLLIVVVAPLIALSTRYAWSTVAMRVASFAVFAAGLGWFVARTVSA
jgi:HupE / UreJ protein